MSIPRLRLGQAALLVVDVQEKLWPHMHNAPAVKRQVGKLIDGANALGMPILVTEQYRKGLGSTIGELADRLSGAIACHEKLKFSALIDPIKKELISRNLRSVLVCGIEAHVCVLQTCLDLAGAGYLTAVVTDAIGSRLQVDQETAVMRMVQAGVIPTTVESALLELIGEAGGGLFKAVLPIIK